MKQQCIYVDLSTKMLSLFIFIFSITVVAVCAKNKIDTNGIKIINHFENDGDDTDEKYWIDNKTKEIS